ncbi:MAG: InlB B-repeat-containing protein [Clostridia bacterium]|nr:InlB B-repeat-containing protein [Clostridia bacterium]
MNKLTKLLSVFIIAGAVGTGIAGVAGCQEKKPNKPSGVHHTEQHKLNYESKDANKHTITCDVPGCDYQATEDVHHYDGDEDATCNDGCGYVRELGGGTDEKEYDLITTSVNFKAAANEVLGGEATGNVAIPNEGYTYGGKFFFSGGGARFEPGSNCVNTQKQNITITLGGITNSIKIVGKGASGTAGDVIIKNESGTELVKDTSTGNSAPIALNADNLPAGVYTIVSGTSVRLTEITITEKLEKSEATGISVTATKVDFLKNEEFSAGGLTVILNYANGRKDTLSASDYVVTQSVDKNTAGKYTVTVKYKDNEQFTDTYDVYYYTVDSIEMHTIGYDGKNQLTLQQAAVKGGELSYDNLTVKGTGTVEGRTHTFNLPVSALNIENVSVAEEGEQTVNVSVKTEYATGGAALADSYKVMVKEAITATDNKVEVTVGATGDFKTLTQAVQYLKACDLDAAVNKVIKLQAGTYTEKVWLDVDNVTLMGLGDNIDDTKLTYSLVEGDADAINGSLWGLGCATLHVTGKNFKAYNLAIRNDFDYIKNSGNYSGNQAAQGVALTLDADGSVIYKCHLYGNQDTLFMKSGRAYYYQSQIDGNVDFIFGNESALAYFDDCTIVAINRTAVDETTGKGKEQNGYVTAAKHDDKTKPDYGYVFNNCEFTDDGKVKDGAMSLGRPWGAKATVAYINCSFSAAYSKMPSSDSGKDHRWHDWNSSTTAANADFSEFGSTGAGAITEKVLGGEILTAEQAANYTKANIFGTENGKQTYTTVFDCEAQYSNLRILVGLDEGTVEKDPHIDINLKDVALAGNCTDIINTKYGETLTWAGTANLEQAKPENGVKVGLDTVITFNVVGEVSIVVGYPGMVPTDYLITYKDGKATVKFVKLSGQYGDYIGSIVVDTSKTPEDSDLYDVLFDLNYEGKPDPTSTQVIGGSKVTMPNAPKRAGYTFVHWYVGDDDSVAYDFENATVTADITLKAKWVAGEKEYQPITAENAATVGILKRSGSTSDLLFDEDYFKVEGDWSNSNNHPTFRADNKISFYVTAGANISFNALYSNGTAYTFKAVVEGKEIVGQVKTADSNDYTTAFAIEDILLDADGNTVDITGVEKILVEVTAAGNNAYCHNITVTYPAE